MFGTKVDLSTVVAWALWAVSLVFILAGTLVVLESSHYLGVALALMAHGLACSAAAATATVRDLIFRQNRLLADVFELGRETGGSGVRQMRGR